MGSRFLFNEVVLQPTSLCNLDCSYCYVPFRNEDRRMMPAVTARLAESLAVLPRHDNPIYLLWHCGEPLATGVAHLQSLFEPLGGLAARGEIAHRIQTNGTLIDDRWCDFFAEHRCEIAVSLDGPPSANKRRLTWGGKPSFDKTVRGIERLRAIGCEIAILAVVTEEQLDEAASLYAFFAELGCARLGINIEERAGVNLTRKMVGGDRVGRFWTELYEAHQKNPVVEIRELRLFADWWRARGGLAPEKSEQPTYRSNYLPTELLQCDAGKYGTFEVGNILVDTLDQLVARAKKTAYVKDYLAGVDRCKATCDIYDFCGGGFPTNKFFEQGTMDATETTGCVNSRKRLFHALATAHRNGLPLPA